METNRMSPKMALNKAFLRLKPIRADIERFKTNLVRMFDRANDNESEEFHKNLVSDFLKKTYYDPKHFINTKGRNDLVIHSADNAKSPVGVILEAKKPGNKAEMISEANLNAKALHELVLYYMRERFQHKNLSVNHLIATNLYEWFVFDAAVFERLFAQNKIFAQQFHDFENGRLADTKTSFFYKEIAAPFIARLLSEGEKMPFAYFNLQEFQAIVRGEDKNDDKQLIALFKLLSPEHLLKLPFANDSNSLDQGFYSELLHIIGLTEIKDGGKNLIVRLPEGKRLYGSILENAIVQLESLEKVSRLAQTGQFGDSREEHLFNIGLELSLTWINRVLFLKLLEAQLLAYHGGDKSYSFLGADKIKTYDNLDSLFFQALARKQDERHPDVKRLFEKVPYLNSSLFELTDTERNGLTIGSLKTGKTLPIFASTVLKDAQGHKRSGEMQTLEYLLAFLDAYDFAGDDGGEIQEENKRLINAAVLGLIFEKINGYKDGSFFTPGFITMYMCRETIRKAVVQKFNSLEPQEAKNGQPKKYGSIADIYEAIAAKEFTRAQANKIVNSIKICDPAVGSGHFLVSALNEMIALKSELKILEDKNGKSLNIYQITVVNDELFVTDNDHEPFHRYMPRNDESQRVQETLFHEKQRIIENCLFGVDINPNSVKICRLRLWIELLKNAYYKGPGELETLPNLDINIKCGNSLVSRFATDADLGQALKKSKWTIDGYRMAVATYRRAENKEQKREMERLIADIKSDFRSEIAKNDPMLKKASRLGGELYALINQTSAFEQSEKEKKAVSKKQTEMEKEIAAINAEVEAAKTDKIYANAFEWRFEFPEVLDDAGNFTGFDVVIGNPPYIALSKIKALGAYFEKNGYQTYSKGADVYCLFYERGANILKEEGLLSYITSNSWLRAIYGEPLKKYLKTSMQPLALLNIEDAQVFAEATVESNIMLLQKTKPQHPFPVANLLRDYVLGESLSDYFAGNHFYFSIPDSSEWFLGNQTTENLKVKIETGSKLLKDFDVRINIGLLTGHNEAFIIDEEKKNALISADPKSAALIKPLLRGRDLKKYAFRFQGVYLINAHNGIKAAGKPRVEVERDYPAVYEHLKRFSPEIEERHNQGDHWANMRNCAYLKDFESKKIIWGEISDKPKFVFDDSGCYAEATTFLMTGEKLKFLLAILNSKVSEWYFNLIGTTTGMGTNRWKKYKIELLPIKEADKNQEKEIVRLVDKILKTKKQSPEADTTALEAQIDRLVYGLYGLNDEEIAIVEAS